MEFKDFITEQKNTHMTHIEDKVLYGGVNGTRQAINALRELRDMLRVRPRVNCQPSGTVRLQSSVAKTPDDGNFFVAKKGIFAKNPKIYKSAQEIDADMSGDLADKMKLALKHLPELGIKGVIQGDFLFSKPDLKTDTIDGQKYVTFHPNTIIYAVPYEQADALRKAKIGIVWHTTYTGKDFEINEGILWCGCIEV